MSYCVEFEGVCHGYADTPVLQDITLSLPEATTTAIVGASGSGKTTLLRLINALIRPQQGRLRVLGAEPPAQHLEAYRRSMGYAVQGAMLLPHLSAFDNVALLPKLEGWPDERISSRAVTLFERLHLPAELRDRYPAQLSGGQAQRVGLARALMLSPRLLLLDEPFSAIDPITRAELHEHFSALQSEEEVSTVLVTHDMREAVRLAGYLVILEQGRVAQAGPMAAVLDAPATDYVARLVAEQLA